ncbi:MAG TPA: redox-regulated ATPase YchF, partial [bacterium]|nr:redox-regulated ATPase YchF [bacterium]
KSGDEKIKAQLSELKNIQQHLSQGRLLKKVNLTALARELVTEMNLLTIKPAIYIANIDDSDLSNNRYAIQVQQFSAQQQEPAVVICGKIQQEISQLDAETQLDFLKEWGIEELSLDQIVRAGYQVLDLITFFTANENEARAWTIPYGTTVHKAAGKIHTDFERGFIKAEVISSEDLLKLGSEKEVKQRGLMAIQGKDYIVEDGDIIFFRSQP